MTIDAGDVPVRSVQIEIGVPVMIEATSWPFIVRMANRAICAVMTVVVIVFQVATDTCRVHFIGKWIRAVTIITGQQGVTPQQREVCIASMIETGIGPRNRVVAIFAFVTASTFVRVIGGMAVVARTRRILEDLSLVTVKACGVRMIAHKGVAC